MQTSPLHPQGAASCCPSPVAVWKTLLTYLLEQHYGLTLSDTPFSDETTICEHIDAGIALSDAMNFLVEKYELVRTDRSGFTVMEQSPYIGPIDILRARKATGLMERSSYQAVNTITRGKSYGQGQSH